MLKDYQLTGADYGDPLYKKKNEEAILNSLEALILSIPTPAARECKVDVLLFLVTITK